MTMEVHVTLESDGADGVLGVAPAPASAVTWNGTPCGTATVLTTESIVIEDTTNDKDTGVIIDLSNGPLENSSGDGIPMSVDLGAGRNDTFGVNGTTGNDFWTFGRSKGNLQEDEEAEITFESFPDLAFGVTGDGTDRACANGGHGTGDDAALITWVFNGGGDVDTLCGGNATDGLIGEGGADNLRGYGSPDLIKGRAGEDKIFGSSGNDELRGNNGHDEIDGGTGQDLCYGGEGTDTVRRCEIGTGSNTAAAVAPALRLMELSLSD
jgi:Ca2+-binding RTX toxin-like protein